MSIRLKRAPFRELTLNRSSAEIVRSKVWSSESDNPGGVYEDRYELDGSRPSKDVRDIEASGLQENDSRGYHSLLRSAPHTKHRHRRRAHPIHSLPPEVLAHIFHLGSFLDTTFLVTVTHVSSLWRDLCISTPSLWRRVVLTPASNTERCQDLSLKASRAYIARAKGCSLDVVLRDRRDKSVGSSSRRPPKFDIHSVQYCMHVVTPHLYRWRSLYISFEHQAPFLWNASLSAVCGKGPKVQAPNLEEISLIYPNNDDTKEFTLFSGYAPRLRRATIDGIRLAWLPSLFANITFLDYTHRGPARGNQAVSMVLAMLETSRRLRELRLCFPAPIRNGMQQLASMPGHSRSHKRVTLPQLSILHLSVDGADIPHELYTLLPLLSLPLISSLHLRDYTHSTQHFSHLGAFLKVFRLPPTVMYLWMEGGWVDYRIVPSIMHSLKVLRRATITGRMARLSTLHVRGLEVSALRDGGGIVFERKIGKGW